jgi:hypothetical protein
MGSNVEKRKNFLKNLNSYSGGWSPYWVHSARRPRLTYYTRFWLL